MTAVIIGANGQDGYYLSRFLESINIKVIGVSRSGNFLRTDITQLSDITDLIRTYRPDYIFHFAADSTTKHEVWRQNHEIICTGTLNILEAVRLLGTSTRVFLSGSGLQFKNEGKPIKETDPFEATSQYAVSRIHSVYAARYYRKLGIKAYVGYFFNHDSPLRSEKHVTKKITEAVKRIVKGSNEKLEIGDVSVKKEWAFAGDIVQAVWIIVQQDKIFEATIGTGKAYAIAEWLDACFSLVGKKWQNYVLLSDNFEPEFKILVSEPSLINSLGWNPKVSFTDLAAMMLG